MSQEQTKTVVKKTVKKTAAPAPIAKTSNKTAIILIRGFIGMRIPIKDTLFMMRLRKKYTCVIVEKTPVINGMIKKCKDYITWGEISSEVYDELIEKRGKKNAAGKLKQYFSLNPPRKGFERKGTKMPFTKGGALGYRGEKINDLIKRMV